MCYPLLISWKISFFQDSLADDPPERDEFSVTFFSVILVLDDDCLGTDYFSFF